MRGVFLAKFTCLNFHCVKDTRVFGVRSLVFYNLSLCVGCREGERECLENIPCFSRSLIMCWTFRGVGFGGLYLKGIL